MSDLLGFIGTYTGKGSKGIYSFKLDSQSGKIGLTGEFIETVNPSYLAINPNRSVLYSVNEKENGSVSAFRYNPNGKLEFLNDKITQGAEPAYVATDKSGQFVTVANYRTGSVCVFQIQEDGIGEMTDFVQHYGHSVNKQRQEGPHAHCTVFDCTNKRLYVCDLGLDKVMIYRFNEGKLENNSPESFTAVLGAGPRHLAIHPNCRYAYITNEMASTITSLEIDEDGGLIELQTLSSLQQVNSKDNTSSDIHISQSGQFLYCSNRGMDTIAVFEVGQKTGYLSAIEYKSVEGKTPRSFCIDPTGCFLLSANMDSNEITTFKIDKAKGTLAFSGYKVQVPTPSCIVFS